MVKRGYKQTEVGVIPEVWETSSLSAIKKPDVLIRSGTKLATSDASVQPLGSLFEQMLLIYFDSVSLHLAGTDEETLEQMAARHASVE